MQKVNHKISHLSRDLFGALSSGEYSIEFCPLPEVGEGEVLVKVLAAGVCAGDAKCYA